ncbi:GntR family transcriptional regulator [Pseudooceanicola sp. C21-150M6]|uniref:GntR family transcriptional regulator n=1 Tax=Pseudooceanicola sp. C21-150M6 TaxID=3434355 RepID=UPI003D7F7AF4
MTETALADDTKPLTALLRDILGREQAQGQTKRDALRIALVWAINSGRLAPGTRLPPETVLTRDLGVSLGTVQAALRQVQDLGLIERRRGDGTTVAAGTAFSPSVWHFRMYLAQTGEPFRIHNQEIEVLQTTAQGRWTEHLGDLPTCLMIRRRIEGTGGVVVGAEMVLDPALVPPHLILASELRLTNLRTVIEQKIKVKAAGAKHRVHYEDVDPRRLASFGMDMAQRTLTVDARTVLTDGRPFYFQSLYTPADQIELEF